VTRIIAGEARGHRLEVPGSGTRPTSDRVRESLFAALESADAIADARVLDLYAGSGALGLEALSRGATSVDLVERSRPAAAIVRRNSAIVAKALSVTSTRVHESAVLAFLKRDTGRTRTTALTGRRRRHRARTPFHPAGCHCRRA
jgi:16S rRNA (guanine966-N2)-methyltransferase